MKKTIIAALLIFTIAAPAAPISAEEERRGGAGTEYAGIDLEAQYRPAIEMMTRKGVTSYTDIEDERLKEIAGFLKAANIMQGPTDTEFRPSEAVTRAEYARIILRVVNQDAKSYDNAWKGAFYDVSESDERASDIKAAYVLGLMRGFDDNSFRPDNAITPAEAVTVMLRAMGYADYDRMSGGYYPSTAGAKLLNGVEGGTGETITRRGVARLVYNGITAPMFRMDAIKAAGVSYSAGSDVTLLSEYHRIYKASGVVQANTVTKLKDFSVAKATIVVDGEAYRVTDERYNSFIGYSVNIYYSLDGNDDKTAVYVSRHGNVEDIQISAGDVLGFDGKLLSYLGENGREKRAKIADDYYYIYNGHQTAVKNLDHVFDIDEGMITLVSNGDSDGYRYVIVNSYENVILRAPQTDGKIIRLGLDYDLRDIEVDTESDRLLEIIGADGNAVNYSSAIVGAFDNDGIPITTVDLSAIPSEAVLCVFSTDYMQQRDHKIPSPDARYIKIMISDKTVSGTLEGIAEEDDIYVIDGKDYKVAKSNFLNEPDSKAALGDTGTFYLDISNKIVAFKPSETNPKSLVYGYLISASKRRGLDDTVEFKLLSYDGEILGLKSADKLRINGARKQGRELVQTLSESAAMLRAGFTISQLIKYRTDSQGAISEIETVLAPLGIPFGADQDRLRRSSLPAQYDSDQEHTVARPALRSMADTGISNSQCFLYFKPDKYFSVPSAETFDDYDYYVDRALTYNNITLEMYDVSKDLTPAVALEYIDASGIDRKIITISKEFPVMIKKLLQTADKEGNPVSAAVVITGNSERTFYGENENTFAGCEKGQMVWLYTRKADNTVSQCRHVLFNGKIVGPDTLADVNVWYENGEDFTNFAEVYLTSNDNKFVLQAGPITNDSTGERQIQVTGHANTNIHWQHGGAIVYDASVSKNNPVIKSATMNDFKSVLKEGASGASKVYWIAASGGARQYIIYNGVD